jgi:hypothetical protein
VVQIPLVLDYLAFLYVTRSMLLPLVVSVVPGQSAVDAFVVHDDLLDEQVVPWTTLLQMVRLAFDQNVALHSVFDWVHVEVAVGHPIYC